MQRLIKWEICCCD